MITGKCQREWHDVVGVDQKCTFTHNTAVAGLFIQMNIKHNNRQAISKTDAFNSPQPPVLNGCRPQ